MPSPLRTRRIRRIESYSFPPALVEKLLERNPDLSRGRAEDGVEDLRAWFLASAAPDRRPPPPTGVADAAWREFLLMTKKYRTFCDRGFDGYVHYPPEA